MKPVGIDYYNGRTSQPQQAEVWLDEQGVLHLELDGQRRYYALADVEVGTRLGNTPRRLGFPDGASGESRDNDALDALLAVHQPASRRWLHVLESRYSLVLAALLLTVLLTAGFVLKGVPWLAEKVARALPPSVDQLISEQTLSTMDRLLFKPSTLDADTREDYRRRFARLAADRPDGHAFRLVFRSSPVIGANALALPDGTVLMTDELVKLAQSTAEVEGVLAHEIGHVVGRHGLRRALQSSLVVLVMAAVTGDVGSSGGLAAMMPVVLLEAGYSRELEEEADSYAYGLMQRQGIPLSAFASMLRRLAASTGQGEGGGGFLDTHPAPLERAARFEKAAPQ